jgi:hypothetical protein
MYGVRTVYRACTDVRYGTGFFRTRTYVHSAEPYLVAFVAYQRNDLVPVGLTPNTWAKYSARMSFTLSPHCR